MVYEVEQAIDKQQIRDQIGEDNDVFPIIKDFKEEFIIEHLTTEITSNAIGTSFILGHPVNGILGTSNLRKLGRDPIQDTKIIRGVVNPFNRFKDYFRGTTFRGTTSDAIINTTNFQIEF